MVFRIVHIIVVLVLGIGGVCVCLSVFIGELMPTKQWVGLILITMSSNFSVIREYIEHIFLFTECTYVSSAELVPV